MADPNTDRKLEITLLQERSSGTFARVYMARARAANGLTRIVAVKVLREKWANTKEVLTRTRDEAQLLARLQHPNILRVEAITEVEGQPAIVMEFVHGADLGQIMEHLGEREAHFPFRTIYEVVERVTGALAAAYFRVPVGMREPLRVVHRDIKPSNIMLSAEGALKVLDFGTARFDDVERVARTEAIRFGSLKYMSSERREGDRGDHSSDIYSVGLLLLELLHGSALASLPMERADHDLKIQQRIDALTDFGLPNEGWDTSLRQSIGRMLAYDADQRLDAPQCVKLFRAFKEQSVGDSMSAFAEQVVAPMAGNIFAVPDGGKMSGARFELEGPTSGFSAMEPEPPTEVGIPAVQVPQSLGDLETQSLPRDQPLENRPLSGSTLDLPRIDPRPGYAFGNLDAEAVEALPTHDGPDPFGGSSFLAETTTPLPPLDGPFQTEETVPLDPSEVGPVPPAPPTMLAKASPERSEPRRAWVLAAGGCAIATLLICIGMVAVWATLDRVVIAPIAAKSAANPSLDIVAGEDTPMASVSLRAGDPTVQWVRLVDRHGTTVIRARPEGTSDVPIGEYILRVKVVARPILQTALSIGEDTSLRCKPATMGRVRCTDEAGVSRVLLQP